MPLFFLSLLAADTSQGKARQTHIVEVAVFFFFFSSSCVSSCCSARLAWTRAARRRHSAKPRRTGKPNQTFGALPSPCPWHCGIVDPPIQPSSTHAKQGGRPFIRPSFDRGSVGIDGGKPKARACNRAELRAACCCGSSSAAAAATTARDGHHRGGEEEKEEKSLAR